MKKYMFIAASAALLLSVSCTKDDFKLSKGTPVTVEIGMPETEDGTPTLKVSHSFNTGTGKHDFTWEAGDEIMLIAHQDLSQAGETANYVVTYFSTKDGGSSAVFKGDLGSGYTSDLVKTWAIFPSFTPNKISFDKSGKRLKITPPNDCVIPEVQDGTGYKYCFFASNDGILATDGEVTAFTTAPKFKLANALLRFSVSSVTPVQCIKVTVSGGANNTGLAGTPGFVTSSTSFNSGCSTKTITLVNGGMPLNDVVLATRKIEKDATLTFECYADQNAATTPIFTRSFTMTNTYVGCGNIYNLGTLQAK